MQPAISSSSCKPARPAVKTPESGHNAPGLAGLALIAVVVGWLAWSWLFAGKPLADVNGTVTYRGKPITCGSVILCGSDGRQLQGQIKPDGSFSVAKVPEGNVRIAVISVDRTTPSPRATQPADGTLAPADGEGPATSSEHTPIPNEFSDVNRSGLLMKVHGPTNHNLDLK